MLEIKFTRLKTVPALAAKEITPELITRIITFFIQSYHPDIPGIEYSLSMKSEVIIVTLKGVYAHPAAESTGFFNFYTDIFNCLVLANAHEFVLVNGFSSTNDDTVAIYKSPTSAEQVCMVELPPSKAQKRLEKINYPMDMIPSEYIDFITGQVFDVPVFYNSNPTEPVELGVFLKSFILKSGINIFTNEINEKTWITVDLILYDAIQSFIECAELLKTQGKDFKQYQEWFMQPHSVEELRESLMNEPREFKDKTSFDEGVLFAKQKKVNQQFLSACYVLEKILDSVYAKQLKPSLRLGLVGDLAECCGRTPPNSHRSKLFVKLMEHHLATSNFTNQSVQQYYVSLKQFNVAALRLNKFVTSQNLIHRMREVASNYPKTTLHKDCESNTAIASGIIIAAFPKQIASVRNIQSLWRERLESRKITLSKQLIELMVSSDGNNLEVLMAVKEKISKLQLKEAQKDIEQEISNRQAAKRPKVQISS